MRAVIVSRTKMHGNDRCIGALAADNQSLRLLNQHGGHQSITSPFQIGQLWDLEWTRPGALTPPHVEDVFIRTYQLVGTQQDLRGYLLGRVEPWRGGVEHLFDELLDFTSKNNGYICKRVGVPNRSTGFWLLDRDLTVQGDGKHFDYPSDFGDARSIAYVGEPPVSRVIPAGTLVRVSLARWWRPRDAPDMEERCYLQLSGCYG